jgi:hypothetical protein
MELCSNYPTAEDIENYGVICWAGSEISANPCTREYSLTCPHKKESDELYSNIEIVVHSTCDERDNC